MKHMIEIELPPYARGFLELRWLVIEHMIKEAKEVAPGRHRVERYGIGSDELHCISVDDPAVVEALRIRNAQLLEQVARYARP